MGDGFYKVVNFEKFQHYKDRNPTWIKIYNSLLDNLKFLRLKDASKMHLIGTWLLASRYDNRVPDDLGFIASRIGATEKLDMRPLVSGGFLEHYNSASELLADCSGSAIPEKRREETEKRERKAAIASGGEGSTFGLFWSAWPKSCFRKGGRADCERHWVAKNLDTPSPSILACLEAWKLCRQWQDPQYIPGALTWLRQEHWNNAFPPPASPAALTFDPENLYPFRPPTPEQLRIAHEEEHDAAA